MEFGKSIKKQRAELGLTQQEVAEKLSITRQTLSNWENDKSYPDLEQLIKLSDIYGFSIDSLLKGDPNLRKSLDSSKVERILSKLDYTLPILGIAMAAVCFTDIKQMKPITLIMTTAIFIEMLVVASVQHKMDRYIGYSDPTSKQLVKTFAFTTTISIIIGGVIFFTIGYQNMWNTIVITFGVSLVLSLGFAAFIKFGYHVWRVNEEAKEHGMTLDEWLEEQDREKKAAKSTANKSKKDDE